MSLSLSRSNLEGLPEDLILATASAAAPRGQAADAWARLMGTTEFHDISPSVQRLVPQIFLNLRNEVDVPSRERLKGAYRYTWTKNVHLWSQARGVFEHLRAQGVDYRLLKGAALHAYSGSVGSRSIGDFDLLVHSQDVPLVTQALRASGFRQEGSRQISCGHGLSSHAAINFNLNECHVDVHVAPVKEPSALLSRMLMSAPLTRRLGGTNVQIPKPVHLLLHAAWHASQRSSPTDLAQGLVDIALLAPSIHLSELSREAASTGQERAVRLCASMLDAAGLNPDHLSTGLSLSPRLAAWRPPKIGLFGPSILRTFVQLKDRQVVGIPLRSETDSLRGLGLAYRSWLRLGRPGKLEPVLGGARGFLRDPGAVPELPALIEPFAGSDDRCVTTTPWSETSLDWRFRILLPSHVSKVRVILGGDHVYGLDAAIFLNGSFQGRLAAGDESLREVHCPVTRGHLEFSIRPLWAACSRCFPPLTDLTVSIEDISLSAPKLDL